MSDSPSSSASSGDKILITSLLKRLWPADIEPRVTADEIAFAIGHVFDNKLSPVQVGALLTCLHFTGRDRCADVIAKCAHAMREAAQPMDFEALKAVVERQGRGEGGYRGGLVGLFRKSGFPNYRFRDLNGDGWAAKSCL